MTYIVLTPMSVLTRVNSLLRGFRYERTVKSDTDVVHVVTCSYLQLRVHQNIQLHQSQVPDLNEVPYYKLKMSSLAVYITRR
jgi:hypothetical protein